MRLTTTFRKLRDAGACWGRYQHLRGALSRGEYTDGTPLSLLTILATNGLDDALWAMRATEQDCDRVARLMAADFAEDVLPIWLQHYPEDERPSRAIQAARDFDEGRIPADELAAARAAAWAAAWAAAGAAAGAVARAVAWAVAWDAAGYAAGYAAWDVAWDAAGDAAGAAAGYAAGDAAWDAAWAAARAAARAAAWANAGDAARDRQRAIFVHYITEE